MTAAAAVLAGWAADLVVGDPRRGHPVALFGRSADWLARHMWRDRRAAGAAYTAVAVGVPTAITWSVQRRLGRRGRFALLALSVWAATGGKSLAREAIAVADAVEAGDLDEARRRVPALVGRDPSELDGAELCRAAVESVAENTSDAIVAPLLYGGLGGPAAVVAHRCANTLDAMVGHRTARWERFGWASARLDDVANWLPARATGLLAAAAAPVAGGSPWRAVAVMGRDGGKHPSPNAGPVEAAFAGALGVRLGGVNRYGERVELRGPLGSGPAPGPGDVRRAVTLSTAVAAATAALTAVVRPATATLTAVPPATAALTSVAAAMPAPAAGVRR